MAIFDHLLANLHPGMNKDPVAQPSLRITCTNITSIIIRDGILQIAGQKTFDLTQYTILNLSNQINAISGFTAIAEANGSLSALALIDGIYTTNCTISIFTSPIWQALKAIAQQFKTSKTNRTQAHFQAKPNLASGIWLDEIGRKIYDVTRQNNEPDYMYATRVFDWSLGTRVNNIAIQKMFNDIGYTASVVDTTQYAFDVTVQMPLAKPDHFVVDSTYFVPLVELIKAAGTNPTVILQYSLSDFAEVTDAISSFTVTPGTGQVWGNGQKWGQGHWYPPTQYAPPSSITTKAHEFISLSDSITSNISTSPYKWGTRKWGQGKYLT